MKILDVKIDEVTRVQAVEKIEQFLRAGEPKQIATINPEFILGAQKNQTFKKILNHSDLNLAEATGDLWAASFLSLPLTKIKYIRPIQAIVQYIYSGAAIVLHPSFVRKVLPERIPGSDFFWDLIQLADSRSENVFLLGGRDNVAEKTARIIKSRYPNLDIGYSEVDPDNEDVVTEIKQSKIGILFIGYGAPKQEIWLDKNLKKSRAKVGIGVGGTFDFISGKIKRAPKFMRSLGLEWLWRVILQPSRAGRIYNAFVKFSLTILKTKVRSKS